MEPSRTTRRQFSSGVLALTGLALAGCLGDDGDETDDGGDDTELEDANGENGDDDANGESGDDETNGDDDDDLDGEELDDDEEADPTIAISLENEDGEPIESGATVTVDNQDGALSYTFVLDQMDPDDIDDGTIVVDSISETGTYAITVSSDDDEFDTVEDDVTVDEEDIDAGEEVGVTIDLEGASPAEDDEDDEGE